MIVLCSFVFPALKRHTPLSPLLPRHSTSQHTVLLRPSAPDPIHLFTVLVHPLPWLAYFWSCMKRSAFGFACLVSILAALTGRTMAQSGGCPTFACYNGASCAQGSADYSNHPLDINGLPFYFHRETSRDGQHCACLPGWTGLRCERRFEFCYPFQHTCYNGGSCLPGLADVYGNEQQFCECGEAIDDDGIQYVGEYCETPVLLRCSTDGAFCVNGGVCPSDGRLSCDCPPRFEGEKRWHWNNLFLKGPCFAFILTFSLLVAKAEAAKWMVRLHGSSECHVAYTVPHAPFLSYLNPCPLLLFPPPPPSLFVCRHSL